MSRSDSESVNRRQFVQTAAAGSIALAAPSIATARKTDPQRPVVEVGERTYQFDHDWAQLPDRFHWQTTHNVAVGSDGLIYVIHEGRHELPDHDAIFVFDPSGKYVRSFGKQFQGGGHGLDIRNEGGEDFLYVTAYQRQRSFAKLTAQGDTVWRKHAPMEAGGYADGEDVLPREDNPWGRDRFMPTNFAFHPDGGFFLADGYGSYRIHRYDADGNWLSCFGKPSGPDKAGGAFNLPHGIWIDDTRDPPWIVVADRANARLQWFSLEGEYMTDVAGLLLPANIDVRGGVLLVPDLVGRVTLLDLANDAVVHLGDDSRRIKRDSKKVIRADESQWVNGKFVHPHDACFDSEGNIFVAEWVQRGRVTKLRSLS